MYTYIYIYLHINIYTCLYIAQFGDMLGQLQADHRARAQIEVEKKRTMDLAVQEFSKIEKAYNDSTARLVAAESNAKSAHDYFVKYKNVVAEMKEEETAVEQKMTTVGADSKRTLEQMKILTTYIDEMQHAIDTGSEDVYTSRLADATELVDTMMLRNADKHALRTGLKSPANPKEMTTDVLSNIQTEAQSDAAGLEARLSVVNDGLTNAQKLYSGYQMDFITFSTDMDLQQDLQRAAHSEINQVDGRQMAATMAYSAWEQEYRKAQTTSSEVTATTEEVIAKLSAGLASCGGGAAAKDTMGGWGGTKLTKGRKLAMKSTAQAQTLAGDPVLYTEPADLNDKSMVQGIAGGIYPALHPAANQNLDTSQIHEVNGAVAEASAEHLLDGAGMGMPKDAQWVNSWARKVPGAMMIHTVHLSAMDKQLLAMRSFKP